MGGCQRRTDKVPDIFSKSLIDGKRHQRRGLPFGIGAFRDGFIDLHIKSLRAVVFRFLLYFRSRLNIFFVAYEGIGGFFILHAGVEAVKGKAHDRAGTHQNADKQTEYHTVVFHKFSSFRITVII